MASRKSAQASIDPVGEWLASGQRIKANLLQERVSLHARLQEIDDALMRLSAADAQVAVPTVSRFPDLSKATVNEAIVEAVKAHPRGASVNEIRSWLMHAGKRVDTAHVPSYLFKLKKAGALAASGEKGEMLYSVASMATTKEEAGE